MFFIGVDIAKRKHVAAVLDGEGAWPLEGFEFSNDAEGFQAFFDALEEAGALPACSKVCLESTGHYGMNLMAALRDAGYEVYEVNPLLTSNWRRAQSVRKVKNDDVDARALATWLCAGNPARPKAPSPENEELRELSRSRCALTQTFTDCKRRAHAVLDRVFPEYHGFFSDDFGKASMALMKRFPSADALAHARVDAIDHVLSRAAGRRFERKDACKLKELAKRSVGRTNRALEFELVQLLDQISFIEGQIRELDRELEGMVKGLLITTIPGIGTVCAAGILGEIGNISRFDAPSKLVAYAGWDPSVFSSGEYEGSHAHISKRGSRYLRYYLGLAADRARLFDPVLSDYYDKKRSEGKCHKVAISAVVRKLCSIIFAVLTNGRPYTCPMS